MAFLVAHKPCNVDFNKADDVPVYHSDVMTFHIVERNNKKQLGMFYIKFRRLPWAWKCVNKCFCLDVVCRSSTELHSVRLRHPVVDTPSLLPISGVMMPSHEFTHTQHGMLSQWKLTGVAKIDVMSDFAEILSRINVHWKTRLLALKQCIKHSKTGEALTDILVARTQKQTTSSQVLVMAELLAVTSLDMGLHKLTESLRHLTWWIWRGENIVLWTHLKTSTSHSTINFSHISGEDAAEVQLLLDGSHRKNDPLWCV